MNNWVPVSSADLAEVELEIRRQTAEVEEILLPLHPDRRVSRIAITP